MFFRQDDITSIFSVSLRLEAFYITGQCGEFRIRMLFYTFMHFLPFFVCFLFFIKFVLLSFSFRFPQQNINQLETGIGDPKLSVELYNSEKVYSNVCLQIKRVKASMPVMTQISAIQLSLYPFCLLFQCILWGKFHSEIARPLQIWVPDSNLADALGQALGPYLVTRFLVSFESNNIKRSD